MSFQCKVERRHEQRDILFFAYWRLDKGAHLARMVCWIGEPEVQIRDCGALFVVAQRQRQVGVAETMVSSGQLHAPDFMGVVGRGDDVNV